MGNQHLSILEERIYFLAKNAVFGDGHLWKHPECNNYKVVYTSTTPELLEVKRKIAPKIFTTGVVKIRNLEKASGRFENAKQLYGLTSTVHPIFTKVKSLKKEELFKELTLEDFGLWYLDDGCVIRRSDTKNSFRFFLCIGDCCSTRDKEQLFINQIHKLFGGKCGGIRPNNSKATENNKNWVISKPTALIILEEAKKYNVLHYKFPYDESSTTIPQGSRDTGLSIPKRVPLRFVRRHKKAK